MILNFLQNSFIFIYIGKTSSFETDEEERMNDIIMEPRIGKQSQSFIDQYLQMDNPKDLEIPSLLNNRRSESAEKYFGWSKKIQRKY